MKTTVLIVVAHPDDETLGCAHELLRHSEDCFVLHTTDGAPNEARFWSQSGATSREEYAAARLAELDRAMMALSFPRDREICLGYADRETARHLPELTQQVRRILEAMQPSLIYTHPYEGGHPDHDAACVAVHQAMAELRRQAGPVAELREFTSYHALNGEFYCGDFLYEAGAVHEEWLDEAEERRKKAALDCYESQQRVIQRFHLSPQRWRVAPHYDFRERPHDGPLYYEIREMGYRFEDFVALLPEQELTGSAASRGRYLKDH